MSRRPSPASLALVATLILAFAFAAPTAIAEEGPTITVGHNRIEPATVTIQVGGSVTFHNVDAMPGGHTIVSDDGAFESPPLEKDQTWTHTFEAAGTHTIRIKQHPTATGVIVVE